MSFVKLHSCMLQSSVWEETLETKIVWVTLLLLSTKDGFVDASIPGVARQSGVTLEKTIEALEVLEAPDPYSRTHAEQGRRILKVDGGWFIVNHGKYREMTGVEDRQEYLRVKQAERRAEKTATTTVATRSELVVNTNYDAVGYVYYVVDAGQVKIGFSKNPWARLNEIKSSHPKAKMEAVELTTQFTLLTLRESFKDLATSCGWYQAGARLLAHIAAVSSRSSIKDPSTTSLSTTSTHTEADADTESSESPLLRKGDGSTELDPDFSETGLTPADIQAAAEDAAERKREASETVPAAEKVEQVDFGLKSEDETTKEFPWARVMAAITRICPHMKKTRENGKNRDKWMKAFWKDRGKTIGCFELLAEKVAASDYLMGRNGHKGNDGNPYSLGWIFDYNDKGKLRADLILDEGAFSNEKTAWIIDKKAKEAAPKLTRVIKPGASQPIEVDLSEQWNGGPRYRNCGLSTTHRVPEIIDYKD